MMLNHSSYPHGGFKQMWGGLSLSVGVGSGWGKGLLRAAFVRVGIGVTSKVGQQVRAWGRVSEADHFLHSDAVSPIEMHQPVEGAKRLIPDTVLTAPLQHSEMFHPVTITAKQEREKWRGWRQACSLRLRVSSFHSLFLCLGIHADALCIPLLVWETATHLWINTSVWSELFWKAHRR